MRTATTAKMKVVAARDRTRVRWASVRRSRALSSQSWKKKATTPQPSATASTAQGTSIVDGCPR